MIFNLENRTKLGVDLTKDVLNSHISVKWIKLLQKLSQYSDAQMLVDSKNKLVLP